MDTTHKFVLAFLIVIIGLSLLSAKQSYRNTQDFGEDFLPDIDLSDISGHATDEDDPLCKAHHKYMNNLAQFCIILSDAAARNRDGNYRVVRACYERYS